MDLFIANRFENFTWNSQGVHIQFMMSFIVGNYKIKQQNSYITYFGFHKRK